MDEMIRLYGYMWNVEGAAEKLCKVVVILLFGVWLCAAAGSLEDSGADAFGYSVSGGFAQSRTEAGGELGVALPEVSKGIFPSQPAGALAGKGKRFVEQPANRTMRLTMS